MDKLDPKTDGASADIVAENIQQLKQLFPEAFTEDRVDFEVLRELIGDVLEDREERYSFNWHGKSAARRIAQTPSTGTLRPAPEESVDWDSTGNLFIEGDNLEVLKLLQKSYYKKVKMIYIDPPYNTGKEFIYPDNFKDNLETYLEYTGQKNAEGRKFSTNTDTSGRYHTNWLNMMYPRLKLARNLLRDDGVIFISIDDHEVANLRKLCDEVFGEENFRGILIWQHSIQPKGYSGTFSVHHNFIYCYAKSDSYVLVNLPRTDEHNKNYSNPDNDPNGAWRSGDVRNALYRPNLIFDIKTPSGRVIHPPEKGWRWSKETIEQKILSGEIIFSADETRIIRKIYLSNLEGRTPETLLLAREVGSTREAANEIKLLFDDALPFDTAKPTKLLDHLTHLSGAEESDIILDFFSGSATTAHAVLDLNKEDGGNRKFIMVQLPEPCGEDSEAYKAGFTTIAEIGKERIRRVIKKIKDEQASKGDTLPCTENEKAPLDLGFKVFKLDSSNIMAWDPDHENLDDELLGAVENIKPERSVNDVLYELLLKMGLDLTIPIETREVEGKKVYVVGAGALLVCLEDKLDLAHIEGIAALKDEFNPEEIRVVFRDSSFADDVVKTNAIQILKQHGISDVRSL